MLRLPLLIVGLLLIAQSSFAQTACPSGVAPGSPQCVADAGTSREEAPPRPTGEWIKTWGAIAGYAQRDEVWSTTGKFSEEDAWQEVLGKCNASGATDCKVDMTYFNPCVAMALPSAGVGNSSIYTGKDEKTAGARAMESCERRQGAVCKVTFTECTEPFFNRF